MLQLTEVEIRKFAPRALPQYVDALVKASEYEMPRSNFTSPLRLVNFLAQGCHETGGLTIEREDCSWSKKRMCEVWPKLKKPAALAQLALCADDDESKANFIYSGRTDIGNRPGSTDGWDFRGGFWMQDTGRNAWMEASEVCGVDFVSDPTLYNAAQSVKYWVRKWDRDGYHKLADRHYIRAIGNKINRGSPYSTLEPIGHESRLAWFAKIWNVLGPPGEAPEVPEGMALGAYGEEVKALQSRLRELGYGIGSIDGVFGPTVARAVAAFKLDQKRITEREMEPDEIVGPYTLALLSIADKAEMAPGRAEATEKEIIAVSSTAAEGNKVAQAGTAMVVAGMTAGAETNGLIDVNGFASSVDWLPGLQSTLTPVAAAASWAMKNAVWVALVVFGFWFWQKGRHVLAARCRDFWQGFNLSK
jgi:predicted chitinase